MDARPAGGAPGLGGAEALHDARHSRQHDARSGLLRALSKRLSARGLLLGSFFVLLGWLVVRPVQDPDYWWHVVTGRWILAHGALPGRDLFTYAAGAGAWIDHEYLTEIGLSLIQQAFGFLGVSLVFGAVTWAGIWLIDRRAQLEPQPYVIRALFLGLAAVAGIPFWGPRAQMLTFFFICLELCWLDAFLRRGRRQLYWLPLVMVLWANLHGGFLAGFLFLGLALAATLAEAAWKWDARDSRKAARLALVTAGCAAAALLTPYTYHLFIAALTPQASPVQQSLIVEWLSPDFHQLAFRPFEAMVLALVGGFALRRPRPYEVLLAVATLLLALQSARHIPLFLAACTPILIRLYGEAWRETARRRGWVLPSTPAGIPLAALTVGLLLGLAAFVTVGVARHLGEQQALTRADYPVAASDWLAAHPRVGTRMFNSYGWGGYLVYRFYPETDRRVYVFGEATLMGDSRLSRYAEVENLRPQWRRRLLESGADYVVFNRDAPLAGALAADPEWRLAYQDHVAVIYVRAPRPTN
jgi:hypothetical protein